MYVCGTYEQPVEDLGAVHGEDVEDLQLRHAQVLADRVLVRPVPSTMGGKGGEEEEGGTQQLVRLQCDDSLPACLSVWWGPVCGHPNSLFAYLPSVSVSEMSTSNLKLIVRNTCTTQTADNKPIDLSSGTSTIPVIYEA